MEVIKTVGESPMLAVDDVVFELRRLSCLINMLTRLQGKDDSVDLEDIGLAMGLVRDNLDYQINALDAIQWPKRKAGSA